MQRTDANWLDTAEQNVKENGPHQMDTSEIQNIIHCAQSLLRFINRLKLNQKQVEDRDLVLDLLRLKNHDDA